MATDNDGDGDDDGDGNGGGHDGDDDGGMDWMPVGFFTALSSGANSCMGKCFCGVQRTTCPLPS